MIEDYPELPDDNLLAFKQLEAEYRETFEKNWQTNEELWHSEVLHYMSQTIAAAKTLGIDALSDYNTPNDVNQNQYSQFRRDVDSILVQIRIHYSRRAKELSVGFTKTQKHRIHKLVDKIRKTIEESSVQIAKKEKLFEIISKLTKEVDKPRTGFERFADFARGLASVLNEMDEMNVWQPFKMIMGVVNDAKESEQLKIPQPIDPKLIEAPKKALPDPKTRDNDEIPF